MVSGSPAQVAGVGRGDSVSADLRRVAQDALQDAAGYEVVCSLSPAVFTTHSGQFTAWGAPEVAVGAGNHLPELIARYLIGGGEVRSVRDQLLPLNPAVTTVLVLDGSYGLGLNAPGYLIDGALDAHDWCVNVLTGTATATTRSGEELIAAGVHTPHLWLELATCNICAAQLHMVDTSLGVGRFVATLEVAA